VGVSNYQSKQIALSYQEEDMPKRTGAQRTGKHGERFVEDLIGNHPRWVARTQDEDFGIDLEAELADPVGDGQELRGQLLKIQVKARGRFDRADGYILVSIERSWLAYAAAFRVPVILVAIERDTNRCWWLWMQEWALFHEDELVSAKTKTITVSIPEVQILATGLDAELPHIAEGRPASAMVLALRGVLEVASDWEHQTIARGVVELLGRTDFPSRAWMIGKIVDQFTSFGPHAPYWQAQQMLPMLFAVIGTAGDTLTVEQLLRIVQRGEAHSRVGINALSRLYDERPEHAASLRLPKAFSEAGLDAAAWYAAMRERFPGKIEFGLFLTSLPDGDLDYGGAVLRIDRDVRDHLLAKWPNRGDSVLLDCLSLPGAPG
jgi:hypothetical protein